MDKRIRQRLKDKKGTAATEFVLSFMFTSICFLIVVEFVFLAIGSEFLSYATYMGSRAIKSSRNPESSVNVANRVVPWADSLFVWFDTVGKANAATVAVVTRPNPILSDGARWSIFRSIQLDVSSTLLMDEPVSNECEDNPLWGIPGSEPCP